MPRTRDPVWAEQEQYPCDHCGAEPGERCRAGNGQYTMPHASRFYQFKDAAQERAS